MKTSYRDDESAIEQDVTQPVNGIAVDPTYTNLEEPERPPAATALGAKHSLALLAIAANLG